MGATRPRQQEELLVTFLQTWPKSFKAPARAQRAALAAHMVQAVCVCDGGGHDAKGQWPGPLGALWPVSVTHQTSLSQPISH